MRFLLVIFALFGAIVLHAQEYRFGLYRVEQGLPSDVIKAVAQDSLGFLWIATDDGLVKYDGLHFTTYKGALRSQYAKNFLRTRDGRLFMVGDLDLIEIQNQVDTVIFKSIIKGVRFITDSTISYPKSIFEDRVGNLWLDEPHAIVRYDGKTIKRFDLGIENRSSVFIRSFNIIEDKDGVMYAISFAGKVFRYDEDADQFVMLSKNLPRNCGHALFHDGKLWIASGDGLYQADLIDKEFVNAKRILAVKNASFLVATSDSSLWLTTFNEDLYRLHKSGSTWNSIKLDYSFDGINSAYKSEEGDLWAATNKGVVLIQKNLFTLADDFSRAKFIAAIAEDKQSHAIYYCNKETLVKISPKASGEWDRKILYHNPEEYFQSMQASKNGLWVSNTSSILLFRNDKIINRLSFAKEGDFIHDIYLDSNENLWASQAANLNVLMITDSFEIKRFKIHTSHQNVINVVREGRKGMYAAASGTNRYLFFKDNNENEFVNISLPVKFTVQGDFNIHDMVEVNNTLWLASTEGLLKFDHHTIERINLGEEFTQLGVSSIEALDEDNILFSNSHGLFRYNVKSEEFWLYDENSGLPSNTITARGIFVDHKKQIWLGTSFGIGHATGTIMQNKKTARPYCVEVRVNGNRVRFMNNVLAPFDAFIMLQFSAITFPENKINLQWRFNGADSSWHTLENHQLSFTNLTSGSHQLFVRAKKNTGLGWSEPVSVKIFIDKPYWKQSWFISLIIIAILAIAWFSYIITSRILNKRKEYLERLVAERTKDLQETNEELTQRNNELDRFVYSASHDLSAPLKSVLGLINVSRLEKPGEQQLQYLIMMERSVRKLEEFIRDVVNYSRNARMEAQYESIDFATFINEKLDNHQYAPNFSKIEFKITDQTNQRFVTDVLRLKIILNNLISNAIKFHRYDSSEIPFVKIALTRESNTFKIIVEDNGRGIEPSHIKNIFDMFYRATDKGQGSGLGLYILKETILKMNGTVNVQSEMGKGTIFSITLPVITQNS